MRLVLLVGLVVATVGATVEPRRGYHALVGIPEAARIKALEEKILANQATDNGARIVGGAMSPIAAHPYLGGLIISLVNTAGSSVCGSSLLSPNRAVTAAHCWYDGTNQAWMFTVVLGTNMLFSGGTHVQSTNVVMHPQWNPFTLANDIAMIYLPHNVAFTNNIQPIALPSTIDMWDSFVGEWTTAAGYGKTSDAQVGVDYNTVISEVNVQVISVAQCQAVFGANIALASNICTNGAGGIGICSGDSGGPLVLNRGGQNILVGISSYVALNGCQLGFPSAFARVTSFYSFIVQHL